ncbi:glycosyltransferase family 39 protein [Candidatus Margulisiibacteriota bacterium]
MSFALFLGIINLLKLWLARYLPLLGDEAYYNLWSKHPALGYTDHPPMIAYLHWLTNLLSGEREIGVRLGALLLVLAATWLVYLIGREAFGKRVGIASAVLFNLIPTFFVGGLFLTPEQPQMLCWLLGLYFALKVVKTQKPGYWYPLGLAAGLGLLSKFPMLLFPAGLLLFLLLSKDNRPWLAKKEPYLAAALALVVACPVLIWNIQHGFPSLAHHGARLGSPAYLNNILNFLVLQFFMYSPPLFIFTVSTFIGFWKRLRSLDDLSLLLITISFPAFLAFALVSPFTLVGGHWTSIAYLGMIVLISHRWLSIFPRPLRSLRLWLNLGMIVLINALFVGYYAFLFPVPAELQGRAYTINRQLKDYVQQSKVDHVFSNQMGVASLVAFYGKTEVYLPKGAWKQFDIWGRPQLKRGDNILYFVFADPEKEKKLQAVFWSVRPDKKIRLFTKDSNIPERTRIFICRGYKGGELP